MARPSRRRAALEQDEVLSFAQRGLEFLKRYQKWLILGLTGLSLLVAGALITRYWQQQRQEAAAVALTEVRAKLARPDDAQQAAKALDDILKQYGGVPTAREAAFYRAHLLYQLNKYEEAAKAYKDLLQDPVVKQEPGLKNLIAESLSYCYEGMGNYAEAAKVLKPVEENISGPLKGEFTRRLAWLYEKAGNQKEASLYWQKLLEKPPSPVMVPYLKEKLAEAATEPKK
jgi:tetratricopeptide (TPR) repeat protein